MAGSIQQDCRSATEFYTGNDHTVWVGKNFITQNNPTSPVEVITLATPVAVSDVPVDLTITSGLTSQYYKGQRIRFGTAGSYKVIELAADALVGATTLRAKKVLSAIAVADVANEIPMVPYWSVRATSPTVDGETLEIRNAGACDWSNKLMLKRMHNSSLAGAQVRNDPGLLLLKQAVCSLENLAFIRLIKTDGTAWEGNFWAQNWTHSQEVDTDVKVDFQLEGDGAPNEDLEWAVA